MEEKDVDSEPEEGKHLLVYGTTACVSVFSHICL